MPAESWFVYVLYSVTTGRLYTGISTDPQRRLQEHNAGKGVRYTRVGRPWQIVHVHKCESKGEALRLELQIKKLQRHDRLLLVGLAC